MKKRDLWLDEIIPVGNATMPRGEALALLSGLTTLQSLHYLHRSRLRLERSMTRKEWKWKHHCARSYMREALVFSGAEGISEGWRLARLAAGYFSDCFPWAFSEGGAA